MASPDFAARISHRASGPFVGFVSLVLAVVLISMILEVSLYLPLAVIAGFCFYWSLKQPSAWMFVIILSHILILRSTEHITIGEVIFGLYYFGTIVGWYVKKFLLRGKISTSDGDQYLIFFFCLCLLSLIPALMNEADIIKWFRELIIFLAYLLYFPLKDSVRSRKNIIVIGGAFLLIALYAAISNFLRYSAAASSALYAWQLLAGRQTANEPLFMTSILIGLAIFLYVKSTSAKFVLAGLIAFFLVALILTFSRGYWIGLLIGIAVMLLILEGQQRVRVLVTMMLFALAGTGILYAVFSYLSSPILQTVATRLVGANVDFLKDRSLQSRFAETKIILGQILQNPILGNGLGTLFRFHDPLRGSVNETWYIHNGYLFLWFKLGIGGLFCYLYFYSKKLREALSVYRNGVADFEEYLSLGITAVLASMLVVSITSPQFITRDSNLIIILCWGIIDAVANQADYKPFG